MVIPTATYPTSSPARDRFVVDRRTSRPVHDAWRLQDVMVEPERAADGRIARTATLFLTGRECPWRCVMCDLWRQTVEGDTPPGAIPAQIREARARLRHEDPPATHVKLYNAGSFFDPRAVPDSDYAAVAAALEGFTHVVVESHPALVGDRVDRFLEALDTNRGVQGDRAGLEVAMGLETAHPEALDRLHKRMTVDQFVAAAGSLGRRGVAVRAFLLIAPPFIAPDAQEAWLIKSMEVAFACGVSAVTLIPTRGGNGAMESLAAEGVFAAPRLDDIERSVDAAHAWAHSAGHAIDRRIFVDLWGLERLVDCSACLPARRARLHTMNLDQRILPPVSCAQHERGDVS